MLPMTDPRADTVSIADRAYPVAAAGAPVVAAHFLGHTAVFVLGDEAMLLVEPPGEPQRVPVHDGAILATAADNERVVSGGDDGKVATTDAKGETRVLATDPKHRWIDHVAIGRGRRRRLVDGQDGFRSRARSCAELEAPSTVGGLAFLPKGFRLAIAHYNGATLWFPNATEATAEKLEWKGSHLGATVSPDGRFLVTSMQEPMLHGWRLADGKHMRMSGYATRVTSLAWTADGDWLATSGAPQLILWPFHGKDGPMGKEPRMLAPSDHRVTTVAAHPGQAIVATGFDHGMILLIRVADGAEILARKPAAAPVTALGWSPDGQSLAFGTEDGDMPARC